MSKARTSVTLSPEIMERAKAAVAREIASGNKMNFSKLVEKALEMYLYHTLSTVEAE